MISLIKTEFLKNRKKYLLPITLAITALELAWVFYGNYSDDTILKGWMMFLYQLPLVNAIFLPFLMTVVASRLSDLEHRGHMLRRLASIAPKGALYDAKLVYGFSIVLVSLIVQFAAVVVFGKIKGFGGPFPLKLYSFYWLFTITASFTIYLVQHTLSLMFQNQAVSFFAGVIGEFIGVFSMFLPQIPWLRKAILWGYYGALQFVGSDYDRTTRISTFYIMNIDWPFFAALIVIDVLLYIAGKKLFCEREVK